MVNPDIKANPTGWTTVREWHFDREGPNEFLRRQIYGMTDWIYEGIHFGLLMVYEWPDETPGQQPKLRTEDIDHHKRHDRDVMEFYIAPCREFAGDLAVQFLEDDGGPYIVSGVRLCAELGWQ